jgi:hypothetical protein
MPMWSVAYLFFLIYINAATYFTWIWCYSQSFKIILLDLCPPNRGKAHTNEIAKRVHENNFKQTLQWLQWLNFWVSDHHLHHKDHWWAAMTFLSTKFTNLRDAKSFIKLMNHCHWIIQPATSYAQAWEQHWFHHIQNLPQITETSAGSKLQSSD